MSDLRCVGLRKRFGGSLALDGVSLHFPSPGICALVGANGAGKTTLLNVMTGHLRADEGKVYLGKRTISGLAPYLVARMGIARSFQRVRLFWDMPVAENLLTAFPRAVPVSGDGMQLGREDGSERPRRDAKVSKLLDLSGLTDMADRPARELSYGQQKFLALVCCVATGASIFLLDEPVASLDYIASQRILDLLVRLRNDGKTIVFIEHDLQAVRKVAESVVVLSRGRVLRQGPVADVLQDQAVVEELIG